jgi:proteasome accessory factor B
VASEGGVLVAGRTFSPPPAAPPATEQEARHFFLLKYVYEEPGAFEPSRLARVAAERLEVSEKTIQRDLQALADGGLVEMRGGRCHPGRDFLPKLPLTADQALAVLTYLDLQRSLLPQGADLKRAREKLCHALLGEAGRLGARRAGEASAHRLVKGRYAQQPPELEERVRLLEECCTERRRVRFPYTTADGRVDERLVDPLGLVYYWFHDAWYLVAAVSPASPPTAAASTLRHFRLDRMGAVQHVGNHDIELRRPTAACRFVQSTGGVDGGLNHGRRDLPHPG